MTKQHFIAFAKDIRNSREFNATQPSGPGSEKHDLMTLSQIELICRIAPQFNPKFNAATFRKACGL